MRSAPVPIAPRHAGSCLYGSGVRAAAGGAVVALVLSSALHVAAEELAGLEPFVDGVVASHMAQQHIAGAQVAVVKDGRPLLVKGYGVASSAGRPVDPERSLFRLASISKTFTWIALMQLAERGRLRLEDHVNAHLPPELAIPSDGWEEPVRILDLMNHTAGFEEAPYIEVSKEYEHLPNLRAALRERPPRRVRRPGELFVYSNYGADLAGAIVAHVTGMDFETYIERHVLQPLALDHTTFREPYGPRAPRHLPEPMPQRLVTDVAQALAWKAGAWAAVPYEFVVWAAPSGAASSTAADMARYMIALLDPAIFERAGVLRASSLARLHRESFRPAPGLPGMHHGFFSTPPGIHSVLGHETLSHGGNMAHFESYLSVVPALSVGVFVTTNSATGVKLSRVLQEHVLKRYFPPARVPTWKQVGSLAEYAGSYRDPRRRVTTLEALFEVDYVRSLELDGNRCLRVQTPSDESVCFAPIGRDLFQKHGGDARLAFLRGPDGEITHVVGAVNGERMTIFDTALWLRTWLLAGLLVSLGMLWDARRWRAAQVTWQRWAARATSAAACAWLAFYATGGVWQLRYGDDAFRDYPQPLLIFGLALLLVAVALTAVGIALLPVLWRDARWSLTRRALHSASLLVLVVLALTLHHWNVVGFHCF